MHWRHVESFLYEKLELSNQAEVWERLILLMQNSESGLLTSGQVISIVGIAGEAELSDRLQYDSSHVRIGHETRFAYAVAAVEASRR